MKSGFPTKQTRFLALLPFLALVSIPLSAAQVAIPGTSVSIDAPAGFTVSRAFSGLESAATGSSITIGELPAEAHAEMTQLFSDPALAKSGLAQQGISLEGSRSQKVDGQSVPVLFGSQATAVGKVGKYMAIFRGEATVLITFNVMDSRSLTSEMVEKTIASVKLSPAPTLQEKTAQLPFTFKAVAPFRLSSVIGGSTAGLTTFEGTDPSGLKPLAIIAWARAAAVTSVTPAQYAGLLLHSTKGFETAEITVAREVTFYGGAAIYLEAVSGDRKIVQFLRKQSDGVQVRIAFIGAIAELDAVKGAAEEIAKSIIARN